jgi:phosphoenolpyruvate synthase/pyruvate phosphate dikinase
MPESAGVGDGRMDRRRGPELEHQMSFEDNQRPSTPPLRAAHMQGLPVAPGVGRGLARVLHTPAHQGRLQAGEVLVIPSAERAWTLAFGRAVAVVSEVGGALCHSGSAARRQRLPAVFGLDMATTWIRDGDLIEVDGGTGSVRILESGPGRRE